MKEIGIYAVNKIPNVRELLKHLQKEFPGVPLEKIEMQTSLCTWFRAEPKDGAPARKRRLYKAQM